MATISENLEALKSVKEDIKSAIEGKGQDLTNVPFTEYSNKINEITTKEDLDAELDEQEALLVDLRTKVNELPNKPDIDLSKTTATADDVAQGKQFYNAQGELVEGGYIDIMNRYLAVKKTCNYLFQGFTDEDMSWVKNLNTTGVTTMYSMFYNCNKATVIDLTNFDTSNVTTMVNMFNGCTGLIELDLSSFDTSKVTTMYQMFRNCTSLKYLNISNFDTRSVTVMEDLFYGCSELTNLDLSSFDTSNVTNMSRVFTNCSKLTTILGVLNLISATTLSDIFGYCMALENVMLKNIKISLPINYSSKLTNETLINTIQELWDNTDNALGGSRTLRLSTTSKTNIANIYVKLIDITDDMIANDPYIANKKPCVVCASTDEGAMTLTEYAISKNWSIA